MAVQLCPDELQVARIGFIRVSAGIHLLASFASFPTCKAGRRLQNSSPMLEFGINIPAERPCPIPSLQLLELKCCGSLLCFAVLRGPELFPRALSALRAANAASMQAAINSELASRGAELALFLGT